MSAPNTATEQGGVVAVVGLGKIGLPLAIQYARHGRRVLGCDVNPRVVEGVNAGHSHVHEEPGLDAEVADAVGRGLLRATTDTTAAVREARVVVVIVPVMVDEQRAIDYTALDAATRAVGSGLTPGALVIYETTLPVGTTSGRLRALLESASGLHAGSDFLLAFSPERVSSGHIFRDLSTYPKVVGGIDDASAEAAVAFYRSVLDAEVLRMASADDAELVKLIETTYRDVNIALANEFARYADARGLDVSAAIAAANTQPYSHIHEPGLGVGGHCIPVYPYFLMQGAPTDALTLPRRSRAINNAMADYAADRLEAALALADQPPLGSALSPLSPQGEGPGVRTLEGQAILLLGVAYRGDVREHAFSSARLLREALTTRGARVYASDPLFDDADLQSLGYQPYAPTLAGEIRAVVVQAAHSAFRDFDYAQLPACRVVLDGRRALTAQQRQQLSDRGVRYLRIGDGQRASQHQPTESLHA